MITCPGSVTQYYEAGTSPNDLGYATATDACSNVTVTYSDASTRSSDPNHANYRNYTITRTWNATDECGNSSKCYQLINMTDGNQPTAFIGVDSAYSTGYPAPYNTFYTSAKHQFLILASELTASGLKANDAINALSFLVRAPGDFKLNSFTIKMGHTDSNSLQSNQFLTGLTQVHVSSFYNVKGWNEHAFSTPFVWDGHSNLIVQTCFNNNSYTANFGQMYVSSTSFVSILTTYTDYSDVCNSNNNAFNINKYQRPVVGLGIDRSSNLEAKCKEQITVQLGETGQVTLVAADIDNGSNSSAGILSRVVSPSQFTCDHIGNNYAVLKVTDNLNNEATCSTKVVVNGELPACTIEVKPTDTTFTGGDPKIIYLGYGAQSARLNAMATGGSTFKYAWSPAAYLSSATVKNPIFTPNATGVFTYTVTITNEFGCTSQCNVSICVKDIVADNNKNGKKVYICHVPPGNTGNPQTLSISVNAVYAHLTEHSGDALGKCGATCDFQKKNDFDELIVDVEDLEITSSPNPFNQSFTISYFSAFDTEAVISVYGITGNLLEQTRSSGHNNQVQLGERLPAGMYTVSFVQGINVKEFKMIKVH